MGKTDFSFKDEKTGIKAKKILLYITTVGSIWNIVGNRILIFRK